MMHCSSAFAAIASLLLASHIGHAAQAPLMRDFIGINGHTVQFKPDLYKPACQHVRDYHPVSWDLGTNTSEAAPFPFAKNRVDWSRVYGSWRDKGWHIDASLQIESIEPARWRDLEADARSYGKAFAQEFGPSSKRKLVESVEIGNEPGKWSDTNYARIFKAMAEGIREGDRALKVATCNLTTGKSGSYEKSVQCLDGLLGLVDVLNVHSYAQLENWPTWRRSFPEDPRLPHYLQDIQKLCEWRDQHAPGKPVWLTEFGYDSSTKLAEKTGTFSKWVGVTDEQQALWLVRSLLVFSALPVDRAYIYFFNDEDKPQLHASAGLTRHFQPKPSFHAVAHLQSMLGEYRFTKVATNDPPRVRVQEYQHGTDHGKVIWAVWRPAGETNAIPVTLANSHRKVVRVEQMPLSGQGDSSKAQGAVVEKRNGMLEVLAGPAPLYIEFSDSE